MVDFNALLARPLDDVKRPPVLPIGTYYGIINKYEYKESSAKKTPYVQFTINQIEPGEDIAPEDLEGIDFSKRTQFADFYITPDAEWRLKELIESLGVSTSGRSFGETIPECQGLAVQMDIIQEINRQNPEDPPRNRVNKMLARPE